MSSASVALHQCSRCGGTDFAISKAGAPYCTRCNKRVELEVSRVDCELFEGRKDDSQKLPIHLLPTDALECIAEILDFGAKKYAPRNWEKGMAWSRVYRACIGHLWKWWRGAPADEETGKSHLWHAGCCILFLIAYERRKIGSDDRPETERLSAS